ncbi:MAG: hypothetical protein U0805_07550 [Pirellulales bacterium]
MSRIFALAFAVAGCVSSHAYGQYTSNWRNDLNNRLFGGSLPNINIAGGYGIQGAGGLRANSILGSGGLRGASIFGSGGAGGLYSGSRFAGAGANNGARASNPFGGVRSAYGVNTSRSKPFSAYQSQPTVSPYLNLFRNDLNGNSSLNYSTLVRPQLQQQQTNDQLERQNLQNARRLQSIAAQPKSNPQGSKDQYPTGHQTVFNYMGHYYNMPPARQKRAASMM